MGCNVSEILIFRRVVELTIIVEILKYTQNSDFKRIT
jgi:hypothetical protein